MKFILHKTLVLVFYRQQAGWFLFIFLFFFGLIAPSMQLAYHYALIQGMLTTPAMMAIVWLAWCLYTLKTIRFITGTLAGADHLFVQMLRLLSISRIYARFLGVQALLLLPITGYALIVAGVAWYEGRKGAAVALLGYAMLLVWGSAIFITYRLVHPAPIRNRDQTHRSIIPYWLIVLRFLWAEQKALLLGIKLFGCFILYGLLRNQDPADRDLRLALLVFSLGIFGHGPLLYKCRQMENSQLRCYRALPVPLRTRFGCLAIICSLLLLPEMLTLGWLTPNPIQLSDALLFIGSGYSLLLLLLCLLSTVNLTIGDFLKLCLVLFGILYGSVLSDFLIASSGFFLFTAALLIFGRYWRYEAR